MKWIFIGLLLNSTVTSQHDTREACEGRAVLLREKGVVGKCNEVGFAFYTSGTIQTPITITPGSYFNNAN